MKEGPRVKECWQKAGNRSFPQPRAAVGSGKSTDLLSCWAPISRTEWRRFCAFVVLSQLSTRSTELPVYLFCPISVALAARLLRLFQPGKPPQSFLLSHELYFSKSTRQVFCETLLNLGLSDAF